LVKRLGSPASSLAAWIALPLLLCVPLAILPETNTSEFRLANENDILSVLGLTRLWVAGLGTLTLIFLFGRDVIGRRRLVPLLMALVLLDLLPFNKVFSFITISEPFARANSLYANIDLARARLADFDVEMYRFSSPMQQLGFSTPFPFNDTAPSDIPMLLPAPTIGGYDSNVPGPYFRLAKELDPSMVIDDAFLRNTSKNARLISLTGCRYDEDGQKNNSHFRGNALPRFALFTQYSSATEEEALRALKEEEPFTPTQRVLVTGTDIPSASSEATAGAQTLVPYRTSPDRVDLDIESSFPSVLAFGETAMSGWQVLVDGQSAPLLRTNVAFMGVWVPAGKHSIKFFYSPRWYRVCQIISLSTLAVFAVWVVFFGSLEIRKRRSIQTDEALSPRQDLS
jgi:hypothetical protein